jgi:hypothetical protein
MLLNTPEVGAISGRMHAPFPCFTLTLASLFRTRLSKALTARCVRSVSVSTGSSAWPMPVVTIEAWRVEYNTVRPHSSLGNRTPAEYAELLNVASAPNGATAFDLSQDVLNGSKITKRLDSPQPVGLT